MVNVWPGAQGRRFTIEGLAMDDSTAVTPHSGGAIEDTGRPVTPASRDHTLSYMIDLIGQMHAMARAQQLSVVGALLNLARVELEAKLSPEARPRRRAYRRRLDK